MTKEETKRAKQIAIHAIEEYMNWHQVQLESNHPFPMTSDYLLLDTFKNELIKEAYKK